MVSGVVKQVKVANTDKGKAYNIILDDDEMYGFGFQDPGLETGDKITFNYTQNGKYKNVNKSSLQKDGKAEVSKTSGGSGGNNAKSNYWDKREEREIQKGEEIKHQGCRNSAIEAAKAAHELGLVKVPQKQADKLDAFLSLVDELTDRFIQQSEDFAKNGKKSKGQEGPSSSSAAATEETQQDEEPF